MKNSDLKPIETIYDGHRFRSRLEARWAVFFNALGLDYEYEKEGFDLGEAGFYLPDFWLPTQETLIEIKPKGYYSNYPDDPKFIKIWESSKKFVVLEGNPWPKESNVVEIHGYTYLDYRGYVWGDCGYIWCECPYCGFLDLQFDGRADRIRCSCLKSEHGDKGYNADTPKILSAYLKAKQVRFEHGEKPSNKIR